MKPNIGIDYGLGSTNIDTTTGIRYGVISQHDLAPEALDTIFNGENLSFQAYMAEAKDKLRSTLDEYFSDYKHGANKQSKLDAVTDDAFDAIKQELSDAYTGDSDKYRLERDGYVIETSDPADLFVTKSPYFTRCQFCSPCAPGAGYITNTQEDGPKTYCLGHDWFDNNKAPYPVFSVESGNLVNP